MHLNSRLATLGLMILVLIGSLFFMVQPTERVAVVDGATLTLTPPTTEQQKLMLQAEVEALIRTRDQLQAENLNLTALNASLRDKSPNQSEPELRYSLDLEFRRSPYVGETPDEFGLGQKLFTLRMTVTRGLYETVTRGDDIADTILTSPNQQAGVPLWSVLVIDKHVEQVVQPSSSLLNEKQPTPSATTEGK